MRFSVTILMALLCASGSLALPGSFQTEKRDDKICFHVCFPEKPRCPEEWHPKKLGECWTCCKGPDISVSVDV
ncbi:hypothetical protein F5887DRAFT_977835 [Amanita rubescens]|nr:hypothetical protein F5887DRAFT_977835 [Amanita rubescens]